MDDTQREGQWALVRTIINFIIVAADFVPFLGEIPSWLADAGKFFGKKTDLTPDVSKTFAVATELIEPFTGTTFPSHIFETLLQLSFDWPRIKAVWQTRQKSRFS